MVSIMWLRNYKKRRNDKPMKSILIFITYWTYFILFSSSPTSSLKEFFVFYTDTYPSFLSRLNLRIPTMKGVFL